MPVDALFVRHLDDAVRAGIEATRDRLLVWGEGSTLAVVVGCVAEAPEVLHEVFPAWFSEAATRLVKLIATVGLGLVILGVAGELIFTHYSSLCEGQLQTLNAVLMSDAEVRIASTEKETAQAHRETSVLEHDTQRLKTDSETQRAIAAGANQKAAEANERAAKLEVEAASLRRDLTLQKDRSLVFEDHRNLVAFWSALRLYAGQKAEVRYVAKPGTIEPFDREAYMVAYEIETAMAAGRWKVNFPLVKGLPKESKGVYLLLSTAASPQTRVAALVLRKALLDLPLEVDMMDPAAPDLFLKVAKVGPQPADYGDLSNWPQADDNTILVLVGPRFSSSQFP